MTTVRTVVVNVLDKIIGLKGNPAYVKALVAQSDIGLAELNMDSLSRMEAIMLLEEALGIELDDDEVLEQDTLEGLVRYLEKRHGSAGDA